MSFCLSDIKENDLEYRKENEFFKYIKAFTFFHTNYQQDLI